MSINETSKTISLSSIRNKYLSLLSINEEYQIQFLSLIIFIFFYVYKKKVSQKIFIFRFLIVWYILQYPGHFWIVFGPVAEFSVSICSTPKFICTSVDGIPRLLITVNKYKSNFYKNRMIWILYQFKIKFIIITYLKVKGKKCYM